jgi:hypothetical protein
MNCLKLILVNNAIHPFIPFHDDEIKGTFYVRLEWNLTYFKIIMQNIFCFMSFDPALDQNVFI